MARRHSSRSPLLVHSISLVGGPRCGRFITDAALLTHEEAAVTCPVCREALAGRVGAVINAPAVGRDGLTAEERDVQRRMLASAEFGRGR